MQRNKDRLVTLVFSRVRGVLPFIILMLPMSAGVAAADDQDQWREEILLQFSELRKKQGELQQQVDRLRQELQTLQSRDGVAAVHFDVDAGDYPMLGSRQAGLVLVEFADFECPYCRRHQQNTMPTLLEKYVDTGRLRYLFVNFPLAFHAGAEPAALAGACAHRQDAFWSMRGRLFGKQTALDRATFQQLAKELGLDAGRFAACLEDPAVTARVREEVRLGESLGIQGTPAFLLGRVRGGVLTDALLISGAQPLATFERAIDGLLAETAGAN